ncbi:uncharacterized protein DNG_08140 [Cephalotrichum gorgonifer]|uniref:Uncharacterized protein n=1 Tax=Cephalotrichum gorgonifer TaxID=2041049 RepID=A0AAE8N5H7_9PEZI|nr:uncharacterized protein DNG_08140 [Cephalotrichum gorgonifer]
MATTVSSAAAAPVTRGRRLSKGQSTASITILPKSAHTFDDSAPLKPATDSTTPHYSMQRQDSGYESLSSAKSTTAAPHERKNSTDSGYYPPSSSKTQSRSSTAAPRSSQQPSATKQTPRVGNGLSLYPKQTTPPTTTTLFQFPEPDIAVAEPAEDQMLMPPPSTHYWTSDHTRRMEYAAIDAARRGVRAWAKRNLVPNCLVPKDGGHLDFDDDTGSVRRYRLELEDTKGGAPRAGERRRGWFSWMKKP